MRRSVPPSGWKYIQVGDAKERERILEGLRAQGVTEINGVPIEDFVQGYKPSKIDGQPAKEPAPSAAISLLNELEVAGLTSSADKKTLKVGDTIEVTGAGTVYNFTVGENGLIGADDGATKLLANIGD